MHIFLVHRLHQQADGGYHDDRVRGFDADDYVVELLATADTEKLHTAFYNTFRRVTIARHDTIGERAVVDADTDSGMMLLADIEEGHQFGFNLLQLGGILLVGIFQVLEGASGIDIVARIDTYFLTVLRCHVGGMSREMYVSHQGRLIAVGLQPCRDVFHVFCLSRSLGGKAYQLTSCVNDALGLSHTAFGVVGVGGSHRLNANGVVAANGDVADMGNG